MIQKHFHHLGVVGCLLYFFVVSLTGLDDHSATYDEPIYISTGMAASEFGDFRLKLDTPPLIPFLASLGVRSYASRNKPPDITVLQHGLGNLGTAEHYDIARQFIHSAENVLALLASARFPFVLLAMIGLVYVWLIARLLTNDVGALIALALLTLDPTWQSHACVIACDVPLGAFFAMAVFHLLALHRTPGLLHASLLGLGIALAFLTKYNAPLILPILATISFLHFLARRSLPLRELAIAALASVLSFFFIATLLYGRLANLSIYFGGFSTIYANVPESNIYYLWGAFSKETWIHYYPLATLMKLPLLHVVLIIVGFSAGVRHSDSRRALLIACIPIAVIFGVSLLDKTNYCMRRVLPAYPFLYLLPAFSLQFLSKLSAPVSRISQRILAGMLVLAGLMNILSIPNQMSSMSILFGGDSCGPYLLSDCNIDWGQDLPALADYQREHNIQDLALVYFGQADPKSYGVESREMTAPELVEPRASVYAISVNILIYQQLEAVNLNQPWRDWLDRFEPTDVAGGSIYIYDFREPGRVIEKQ